MHPLDGFRYCPKCGSPQFEVNNFKSKVCRGCGFVYYFNIAAAVAVVIRNARGEILVATRAHEPAAGTLDLPGGFVDMDETAEEAVCREVEEETGLRVAAPKYLFSLPNRYVYSGFEVQTMDLFFECQAPDDASLRADDDVSALRFMAWEELRPEDFGLASIRKAVGLMKAEEKPA